MTVRRTARPAGLMVANAGIATVAPIARCRSESGARCCRSTWTGVLLGPVRGARDGRERCGSIITMASVTGPSGSPLIGHYAAAKAAVISLTQTTGGSRCEPRCAGQRGPARLHAATELVTDRAATCSSRAWARGLRCGDRDEAGPDGESATSPRWSRSWHRTIRGSAPPRRSWWMAGSPRRWSDGAPDGLGSGRGLVAGGVPARGGSRSVGIRRRLRFAVKSVASDGPSAAHSAARPAARFAARTGWCPAPRRVRGCAGARCSRARPSSTAACGLRSGTTATPAECRGSGRPGPYRRQPAPKLLGHEPARRVLALQQQRSSRSSWPTGRSRRVQAAPAVPRCAGPPGARSGSRRARRAGHRGHQLAGRHRGTTQLAQHAGMAATEVTESVPGAAVTRDQQRTGGRGLGRARWPALGDAPGVVGLDHSATVGRPGAAGTEQLPAAASLTRWARVQ